MARRGSRYGFFAVGVLLLFLAIGRAGLVAEAPYGSPDGFLATVLVTDDDGTTGSNVLLELRAPPDLDRALPSGWRLCFTWMKATVLRTPGARQAGSYVELRPEAALAAGEVRAMRLRIAPPAMRYASDLPQGLHLVVPGAGEERVIPVTLLPAAENHVRRDPEGLPGAQNLPLLIPRPLHMEVVKPAVAGFAANLLSALNLNNEVNAQASVNAGFALVGSEAGPLTVLSASSRADAAEKLLRAWAGSWPPAAPLVVGSGAAAALRTAVVGSDDLVGLGVAVERRLELAEPSQTGDKAWLGAEGYDLTVEAKTIRIVAAAPEGFLRGAATLRQAFALSLSDGRDDVPLFHVRDRPRFKHRGLMLDVGRHFFPVSFVKRLLDWMFLLKLNVFHWHLTDDEGWRFEVRAFPNLTDRGAWRGRGEAVEPQYGGGPGRYGGYYSQDDVRDVVRYAADRGITIVPEIDVPGHCYAAIRALPDLLGPAVRRPEASGKSPTSVQGFKGNVLDPASPATYTFLEAVFSELLELFPAEMGVHIGMDEVPRGAWSDDPREEAALLSRLAQWLQQFLADRDRALLGWEEAFYDEGALDELVRPRAAGVAWKEDERFAVRAAHRGFDIILSPAPFLYFDLVQGLDFEDRGLYWAAPALPVERVYSYDPLLRLRKLGIKPEAEQRIRGVQAALWSETVATPERAEEMLFPRLLAAAEIAWTDFERRDWKDFKWRLPQHLVWLQREGVSPGGGICGLVASGELMTVPRAAPPASGHPLGIAVLGQRSPHEATFGESISCAAASAA